MTKINVFDTEKESKQQLEQYNEHNLYLNEKFNEEYRQCEDHIWSSWRQQEGSNLNTLNRQKRYFVAELIAYPDEYLFSASSFPFVGENEFCKDISSLVEGVKDTIKRLNGAYPTIEAVFYTVENHDKRNQQSRMDLEGIEKLTEELDKELEEEPDDDFSATEKEEEISLLNSIKEKASQISPEDCDSRGLNQQEREEFERLYFGDTLK